MKAGPDASTIYRIARYYYVEGLSQEEIGAKEGFSRSQISRLLERAKDLGLVKITVLPPADLHTEELARILVDSLRLRTAVVVPVRKNADADDIALAIATRAADCLPGLLSNFGVVGLGWGHTLYRTAELLPRNSDKAGKPLFVPLIGTSGDDNPDLQINTIIDRFSSSFRSKGLFVNMPSVREKGRPLSKIEEKRIASLEEYWNSMEAVVVGLGVPPAESSNLIAELPMEYREELKKSASCGDILAHYFDADGKIFQPENSCDLLAFDITKLPGIRQSICLAGGRNKHRGILAAARSGYITDLVTDEWTALAVLELLGEGGKLPAGALHKSGQKGSGA